MFSGIYQGPNADWEGVTYFTDIVLNLKILTPLTRHPT